MELFADEYTIYSFIQNLVYLVLILATVRLILGWLDRSLGIRFKRDVWEVLARVPVALALYHGLRLIAVCIVAAAFLR